MALADLSKMPNKRAHISFKTKLVAALCQMRHEVDGKLELILSHDDAKALSEDQVLSLFHWDHTVIPHAEVGSPGTELEFAL